MKNWIRNHRRMTAAAIVAIAALIAFVLIWFEPQALFLDTRVDEAAPSGLTTTAVTGATTSTTPPPPEEPTSATDATASTATGSTTSTTTTTVPQPVVISDSEFIDVGHSGTGRALIVEFPDGTRTLRFEDLDVENGPDLVVILFPSPLVDDRDAYDDGDFVAIGELKGNQGNQNYDIPADVDLDDFATVAIWCRRFNYTFNAAPIETSGV